MRDWAADGVRPPDAAEAPPPPPPMWNTRAWTREVERAYWGGVAPELTLPGGAGPGSADLGTSSSPRDSGQESESEYEQVEALVARVLRELGAPQQSEVARALFRTEYRAVESEVVGLGVKW